MLDVSNVLLMNILFLWNKIIFLWRQGTIFSYIYI